MSDSGQLRPQTEAGRRLLKWEREGNVPWDVAAETILEIEREAAARVSGDPQRGLREALDATRDPA